MATRTEPEIVAAGVQRELRRAEDQLSAVLRAAAHPAALEQAAGQMRAYIVTVRANLREALDDYDVVAAVAAKYPVV